MSIRKTALCLQGTSCQAEVKPLAHFFLDAGVAAAILAAVKPGILPGRP